MNDFSPLFLVLYGNYQTVECALVQKTILARHTETHKNASKNILLIINTLLASQQKKLSDCAFIAVHQGPAPYTTLRTIIATANGLSFATNIPLVGINGLETFLEEQHVNTYDYTIALLNAFGQDIYYGIYNEQTKISTFGCQSFHEFLTTLTLLLKENPHARIHCIGNAVPLYHEKLSSFTQLTLQENTPFVSLEALITKARIAWHKQEIGDCLYPLYLKKSL